MGMINILEKENIRNNIAQDLDRRNRNWEKIDGILSSSQKVEKPMDMACLFYGDPAKINNSATADDAVKIYSEYDIVIFNGNIEEPEHRYHSDTAYICSKLKEINPSIKIFGYIHSHDPSIADNGSSQPFLTIEVVNDKIQKWKNLIGATGIFLDAFGYDYSVSRARQRELVSAVKSHGMNAIVNSWMPDYVFSNKNFVSSGGFQANPELLPSLVDENDYYIFENHVYRNGYYTGTQEANDSERIYQSIYYRSVPQEEFGGKTYYEQYGTKTISLNGLQEHNKRFFSEAYTIALGTGCHAFAMSGAGWSNPDYPHFSTPQLVSYGGEYELLEFSHPNGNELNFKSRIGSNRIDVVYNQPDNVKSIYEFPDTPFVFSINLEGTLNVNSSIQIVLNNVTYYPSCTLGDSSTVVASKIGAFDYGQDWTTEVLGSTINWTYKNGNPENYGRGSGGGNYMYLNSSKGITYSFDVVSTAFRVERRITINDKFVESEKGISVLRPSRPQTGTLYYDTDIAESIWFDGEKWVSPTQRLTNPDGDIHEPEYEYVSTTIPMEVGRFSTSSGAKRDEAGYYRPVEGIQCEAGKEYGFENTLNGEIYLLFYDSSGALLQGWRSGSNYVRVQSGEKYTAIVGATTMQFYYTGSVDTGVDVFKVSSMEEKVVIQKPSIVFNAQYFKNHKIYEEDGILHFAKLGEDGAVADSVSFSDVIKTINNASGATANRPSNPYTGFCYFDTTIIRPIWFDGTKWVDNAGVTV